MLFGAGSGRFGWQLQSCNKALEVMAEARLVVNDQEMLLEAAVAGLGVCMLPKFRCAELLRAGQLQRILSEWQSRDTPLSAVYPSAKHLSAKVKVFVEYLQGHLDPSAW